MNLADLQLAELSALMRSQGITEVQFGPTGELSKVVLSLAHGPARETPATERPPVHPDAAEIEKKAFDEEARKAAEIEERKAYERIAYAASEGFIDDDEDEAQARGTRTLHD